MKIFYFFSLTWRSVKLSKSFYFTEIWIHIFALKEGFFDPICSFGRKKNQKVSQNDQINVELDLKLDILAKF